MRNMETWAFNIRAGKRMLGWRLFWGGLKTDAGWIRGELESKGDLEGH